MTIRVKRIYERAEPADGYRVLVDRVWPRGMSKEAAKIDVWMKEIAPSTKLRKEFRHDPARWDEFRELYFEELGSNSELVDELLKRSTEGAVTLLYSARDERHNQAVALAEFLDRAR